MSGTDIDFSKVLQHMLKLRNEFDEIVEELEILGNLKMRDQIQNSLDAEKRGQTQKYTLSAFRKELDVQE
jgi:hypothetical protein